MLCLQHKRDFYTYSAWCFETRPKLHFLFVHAQPSVAEQPKGEGQTADEGFSGEDPK